MSTRVETLDKVPENYLIETIQEYRDDEADIVTAINDNQGTFTVEATFMGGPTTLVGRMSFFGGPNDTGVAPDEGLSLFDPSDVAANPDIFLAAQPPDTTGLAWRLNPQANYLACRWDPDETPKPYLRTITVTVSNPSNGKSATARPVDTGPDISTGRAADLSPGLAQILERRLPCADSAPRNWCCRRRKFGGNRFNDLSP